LPPFDLPDELIFAGFAAVSTRFCDGLDKGIPMSHSGSPLSRTACHYAAFDAHLIGIDPDFRIDVSNGLLDLKDGPFLELGLKGIAGTLIALPRRVQDCPGRDRSALRFDQFKRTS
jgi:putative restriction endonuclease